MNTLTTKTRLDNEMLVTTTTSEIHSAVVSYHDILDAVKLEPDMDARPYWEECDGFEHEKVYLSDLPADAETYNARSGEITREPYSPAFILRPIREAYRDWGTAYKGASKQVARETSAVNVARTIEKLGQDMNSGELDVWCADCDFLGYSDSLCGLEGWDYANGEGKQQVIDQIVWQLENDGYTIIDKPVPDAVIATNRYRASKIELANRLDRSFIQRSRSDYIARNNKRRNRLEARRAARRERKAEFAY